MGNSVASSRSQLSCHLHNLGRKASFPNGPSAEVGEAGVSQEGSPLATASVSDIERLLGEGPGAPRLPSLTGGHPIKLGPAAETHPTLPRARAGWRKAVHDPEPRRVPGPASHATSGAGEGGAPGAGERRAPGGGRGQGRSGARMRGRLCVGRAAAAAAVAVAVALPLADGLEGSPGGVRRGSRGTTMVKKRKGRVVIDSDTEDSGSDENLDQVRAGREGAGRRSGRAESVPRELGAGRARGHPSLSARPAPCPDRCCRLPS